MSEEDSSAETAETSQLLEESRSNNMEARREHQEVKKFRLFYVVSITTALMLIIALMTWIFKFLGGLSWTSNPKIQFNWHPLLMTIGMIVLYGQSIMLYRAGRNTKKRTLKLLHAGINFSSFILAINGVQAVFDSHNLANPPIPNMYSLHSWIGLTTVILFACQFAVGFVSFLFPGLSKDFRSAYMGVHVNFGILGFLLALIAAVLGLYEKLFFTVKDYSSLPKEAVLVNIIGLLLVIFGVVVLYVVTEPTWKRQPIPEDDEVVLHPTESTTNE